MTSLMQKGNASAAGIFSFNRPEYLKKTLTSLERNRDIADIDFYLFQDGAINAFSQRTAALDADIHKCIDIWNLSSLPNKQIVQNDHNYGIAITQFRAKCLLFDELGYDRALFFEDDLVLSRNYVRLLRLMLDQYENDEIVGAVTCYGGHPNAFSNKEKEQNLRKVRSGNHNFWGWGMWKDRWDKIKPTFLNYYRHVEAIDYRTRPDLKIIEMYEREGMSLTVTSQDAAMHYAFIKNGFVVLNTFIHRGRYIGEKGEHMNPEKYQRIGFYKVRQEDLPGDETLDRFEEFDHTQALEYSQKLFVAPANPLGARISNTQSPANPCMIPVPPLPGKFARFWKRPFAVVFDGDDHINRWEKKETGKPVWDRLYDGRAANFGIEGDCIENLLWRLSVKQVDGMNPKAVVLSIGVNNVDKNTSDEIVEGIQTTLSQYKARCPQVGIILMGIFPMGENSENDKRRRIQEVNEKLSRLREGRHVIFVDISGKLLLPTGSLNKDLYSDSSHLSTKGYEIWAEAIQPFIEKWLI
jgi:lysophospholipase L1-like esterase